MGEGGISHMQGGEVFACKVSDHIMELIVTSCDEDTHITIQGVKNGELGVSAVVVSWDIWRLYVIA